MNTTLKQANRYSYESLQTVDKITGDTLQDVKGRLFMTNKGMFDLSKVNFLHFGVDTVRQLYTGVPRPEILQFLDDALHGEGLYTLNDHVFSVSKMGKLSGYRYKLQNNALGIIILVASYYVDLQKEGTHLKIEVSPHCLLKRRSETTNFLHRFAKQCLQKGYKPCAVALHIACDFQGWQPAKDFMEKFVTRSKTVKTYMGISDGSFDISQVATIYGENQSITFGKASSTQICLYRKDLEADKHDKIDFWRGVWGDNYQSNKDVWRLEVRFHHTVLNELGQGMGVDSTTAYHWYSKIREIWDYALNNNRLELSKNFISPIWQLLRDDGPDMLVKKYAFIPCIRQKKSVTASPIRNISNMLGNMISLFARQHIDFIDFWQSVLSLPIFPIIQQRLDDIGQTLDDLREKLERSYLDRYLIGKAA
ncbi:MAG: hypothetical protein KDI39_08365 [Pseudomonadales bacterium]|nr:hypothetical protein [Pseudomonadales bacterium]